MDLINAGFFFGIGLIAFGALGAVGDLGIFTRLILVVCGFIRMFVLHGIDSVQ